MEDYFVNHISINVIQFDNGNRTILTVSGDYRYSERKSRLHVNEDRIKSDVLSLWKSLKSKKIKRLHTCFDEIDWYDNMTDMYITPVVIMERGKKLPVVIDRTHGSIPKEWSFNVSVELDNVKQKNVIFDILYQLLGRIFSENVQKEFQKELKLFLQGKKESVFYFTDL